MILDVGSGNSPNLSADVLLDKDVWGEKAERASQPFKRLDGKLIVCGDIENLPFKNKSFSFIIASHVIEHLGNPGKGCRELMRVGEKGTIVSPLPFFEQAGTGGWPGHKWYVWIDQSRRLIFECFDLSNWFKVCDCKEGCFVRLLFELGLKDKLQALVWDRKREDGTVARWTVFEWKGSFQYEVRRNE